MSAKSNLSATRKSACNTGSRVAVAPVTVILGPAYDPKRDAHEVNAHSARAFRDAERAAKRKPAKSYSRSVAASASVSAPVEAAAKKSAPAKKSTPSKSKKAPAKPVRASTKTGKPATVKKPKNTKAVAPKPPHKPTKPADERLHVSTVENPVAVMWELCQKMKNARRRDVIAEAQKHGIAFYTARTQYQLWLTASRNSK